MASLDSDDLKLLHDVVDSLEHMSANSKHVEGQFSIFKAIYSIAEELIGSRTTGRHVERQVQLDALILPLQSPLPGPGTYNDTHQLWDLFPNGRLNDWDNLMVDHIRFNVDY